MITLELRPDELYTLWKLLTLSKLGGIKSLSSSDILSLETLLIQVEEKIIERQAELEAEED